MARLTILFLVLLQVAAVAGFAPSSATAFRVPTNTAISATSADDVDESEYDMSLFSPCKINLFLRIIRKRPDGFHDLASLFQTVAFGDMLHLKLLEGDMNTKTIKDSGHTKDLDHISI